jgi:hypothetical protein
VSGRIVGSIKLAALIVFAFLAVSTSAEAAPPTATIVVSPNQLAGGQTAAVTITFSEAVTGFTLSDLTVTNATLSALSTADNITYTTTLTAASGVSVLNNHVVLDLSGVVNVGLETGIGTAISNNYEIAPPTNVALISSLNPSLVGQAVTFTATVSAGISPTGTITFKDGATTLGTSPLNSGQATLTTLTLASGPHAITAVYSGDAQNGSNTSSALSQAVGQAATATVVSSSANPSNSGQAVTFTATVTSGGGTPTGTVTFNDGSAAIGSATLAGGIATVTTSALTTGTHSITAVYLGNGNLTTSTSATLLQAVNAPQDSLKLRALQVIATKTVAQNSGAAIAGAIDTAIAEGFNNDGNLITPGGGGIRFNFSADPDQPQAATTGADVSGRWNELYGRSGEGLPRSVNSYAQSPSPDGASRVDNAFAAINRNAMHVKATAFRYVEPKDWLLWADVRGSGIDRWGSSTSTPILYGSQINALLGLTHRLAPNFLVGALGGYEIFDYRSDALSGHLKGDGWTVGSYLGWRFAPGLRFDAAAAYSGIGYDGTAGTATGNFSGHRWLVSSGLTGNYKTNGFDIEPSAKLYALWETENAYTDSLGTLQAERAFFTGRASAGIKLSYPWLTSAAVTLAPYAGFYADYYFTGDDTAALALAGTVPVASVPLLDGWSARATGGLAARFGNEATVALGAELGGIGSTVQIWTFRGRASVPF